MDNTITESNKNYKLIFYIIGGIVLVGIIAALLGYVVGNSFNKSNTNSSSTAVSSTTSTTPITTTVSISTSVSSSTTITPVPTTIVTTTPFVSYFENDRVKLQIPSSWTSKNLETDNNGIHYTNGGIVLVNGNYTLNIIPFSMGQASGVQGGRFGDISSYLYAPELHIDSANCIPAASTEISLNSNLYRNDTYYTNSNNDTNIKQSCGNPNQQNVWFGSFIHTKHPGGYFADYAKVVNSSNVNSNQEDFDQKDHMVITMSYYSKGINKLPLKNDSNLNLMIQQMTDIINSAQWKKTSGY